MPSARLEDNLVVLLTPRDDVESQNNQKDGTVVDKSLLNRGTDAIIAEANWRDTLVDRGGSVLLAVSMDDDADNNVIPSMDRPTIVVAKRLLSNLLGSQLGQGPQVV